MLKKAYQSIKAFSETDFTEDLKKFDIPTLVLHGEDDQIVPVHDASTPTCWPSCEANPPAPKRWPYRLKDGRVTDMWTQFDGVAMMQQLGAIPA